jgi:hypothetical protein
MPPKKGSGVSPLHRLAAYKVVAAAMAAPAKPAHNLGLRLNLKSAGIPSTFNNNANFSEVIDNTEPGLRLNPIEMELQQQAVPPRIVEEERMLVETNPVAAAESGGGGASAQNYYRHRASLPSTGAGPARPNIFSPGLTGPTFNPNNLMNFGEGAGAGKSNKGGGRSKRRKSRKSRRHTRKSKH